MPVDPTMQAQAGHVPQASGPRLNIPNVMTQVFGSAGPSMIQGSPGITPMDVFSYGQGGPGLGGSSEPIFNGINASGQMQPLMALVRWILANSNKANALNRGGSAQGGTPATPGGGGPQPQAAAAAGGGGGQRLTGIPNRAAMGGPPNPGSGGAGMHGIRDWSPDFGAPGGAVGNRGGYQQSGVYHGDRPGTFGSRA